MSNKGKTFTYADLPRSTQQRLKNKQVVGDELGKLDKWLHDQTERNRVVAMDGDRPLIAEELDERAMRKWATADNHGQVQQDVLVMLRNLQSMPSAWRLNVLNAWDDNGDLIIPFTPVAAKPKAKTK